MTTMRSTVPRRMYMERVSPMATHLTRSAVVCPPRASVLFTIDPEIACAPQRNRDSGRGVPRGEIERGHAHGGRPGGRGHGGCSGWSYKDWRGPGYPGGAAAREWCGLYARRFRTVEINKWIYRLPAQAQVG